MRDCETRDCETTQTPHLKLVAVPPPSGLSFPAILAECIQEQNALKSYEAMEADRQMAGKINEAGKGRVEGMYFDRAIRPAPKRGIGQLLKLERLRMLRKLGKRGGVK